jgi:hypothetical protein
VGSLEVFENSNGAFLLGRAAFIPQGGQGTSAETCRDPVWFPPVLGRRSGSARALRSTGVSEKQRASLGTLKNRTKGLAWGSVLSVAFSLSLWCPFLSETEA